MLNRLISYPQRSGFLSRRALLAFAAASAARSGIRVAAQAKPAQFQLPIAWPGDVPGNGFWIRHGYACENTWYNPGFWHTGEDWYATAGETAGAEILAIADGTVVFAGSDYPGRVVIVQHADDLYSMYGHLDSALAVVEGDEVAGGQLLGSVLLRTDGAAPSHLHFEVRTFLMTPEVNGERPRYGFACGLNCPPGPGYWPIDAPEHPSAMGWRNPSHVIGRRLHPTAQAVVLATGNEATVPVRSLPAGRAGSERIGELELTAGARFPLLRVAIGPDASERSSAEAYRVWYRIALGGNEEGWVQAAIPSAAETGVDGRPSAIEWRLFTVRAETAGEFGTFVR